MKPLSRKPESKLGDVFADLRADIGIGRDGRRALIFVPFARELGAGGDEHVRQKAAQFGSGLFFVIRGEVRIQKADGERFDLERAERVGKRLQFIFHQRRADAAGAFDTLLDLEPQLARDQRRLTMEAQIERLGAVATADLQNIAKALGGDQSRLGAGAL